MDAVGRIPPRSPVVSDRDAAAHGAAAGSRGAEPVSARALPLAGRRAAARAAAAASWQPAGSARAAARGASHVEAMSVRAGPGAVAPAHDFSDVSVYPDGHPRPLAGDLVRRPAPYAIHRQRADDSGPASVGEAAVVVSPVRGLIVEAEVSDLAQGQCVRSSSSPSYRQRSGTPPSSCWRPTGRSTEGCPYSGSGSAASARSAPATPHARSCVTRTCRCGLGSAATLLADGPRLPGVAPSAARNPTLTVCRHWSAPRQLGPDLRRSTRSVAVRQPCCWSAGIPSCRAHGDGMSL